MPISLSVEELKAILKYDEDTGVFTWLADRGINRLKGRVAGSNSNGYVRIKINDRSYLAHVLAWLYVKGVFPEKHIDHINRTRSDNRISNLRECTQKQNCENKGPQKNNTSGCPGVHFSTYHQRWKARIKHNGVFKDLGTYVEFESAKSAYLKARKELFTLHPIEMETSNV